ncbi:MAG TPA: Rod shape-determining protein MreD [Cytophagales bacterium]|nr:Rod shape-determining protein MreD [Cytophagales bacterium]
MTVDSKHGGNSYDFLLDTYYIKMTPSDIFKLISNFFLLFLVQIFFFKFGIFGVAFCFPYLFFLLLLPMSTPKGLLLMVGFGYGLLIDVFFDSPGLHAAACTLLSYLRPNVISAITPAGGYDEYTPISVHILGFRWVVSYTLLLIGAHHFMLFFLEAFTFMHFFLTLMKIIFSTLLTSFLFILMQYMISSKKLAK